MVKRYFLKSLAKVLAIPVLAALVFMVILVVAEYRPDSVEQIYSNPSAPMIANKELKVLSWNIGYCGLGDDMDFFYDGGNSMRTSQQRTQENLDKIIEFLKEHKDADFILLQEVDIDSHRSYNINQLDAISAALPQFKAYFAYNYNAMWVPLPLTNPMGKVESGLVLLSRHEPKSVARLQYPGSFAWYISPANLKRCAMVSEFGVGGKNLTLINTHNSAFDDGQMRKAELAVLDSLVVAHSPAVIAGDWNSTPLGYKQSLAEANNDYFSPLAIDSTTFSSKHTIMFDPSAKTARYGYEPYLRGQTTETLLDFALVSEGVKPIAIQCVDLSYKNSDHNPIIFKIVLE